MSYSILTIRNFIEVCNAKFCVFLKNRLLCILVSINTGIYFTLMAVTILILADCFRGVEKKEYGLLN